MNWNKRILIEAFFKAGMNESNIVQKLERDRRTLLEVNRGLVEHRDSDLTTHVAYNADRAQDVHDLNASAKGPAVKLKVNSVAVEFIRCHIVIRRWSPEVVSARMREKGMEGAVCTKTIYTPSQRQLQSHLSDNYTYRLTTTIPAVSSEPIL